MGRVEKFSKSSARLTWGCRTQIREKSLTWIELSNVFEYGRVVHDTCFVSRVESVFEGAERSEVLVLRIRCSGFVHNKCFPSVAVKVDTEKTLLKCNKNKTSFVSSFSEKLINRFCSIKRTQTLSIIISNRDAILTRQV